MPIVTSTFSVGHAQKDGRKYVKEVHTDDTGAVIDIEYLAPVDTAYNTICNARATILNEQLAEAEAGALIENGP